MEDSAADSTAGRNRWNERTDSYDCFYGEEHFYSPETGWIIRQNSNMHSESNQIVTIIEAP